MFKGVDTCYRRIGRYKGSKLRCLLCPHLPLYLHIISQIFFYTLVVIIWHCIMDAGTIQQRVQYISKTCFSSICINFGMQSCFIGKLTFLLPCCCCSLQKYKRLVCYFRSTSRKGGMRKTHRVLLCETQL